MAQDVAADQAFFHWDLDFAAVFARGGFDLQVGNPPWVRPRSDVDVLLAETDPWFQLAHKPTQTEKRARRSHLSSTGTTSYVLLRGVGETTATSAFLSSPAEYLHLQGQQPDLYRGFMERTWANASTKGVISLIHPESHFTEKKAAPLRREAYLRLRRHWQFINELVLFDIDHHNSYGIHIYAAPRNSVSFLNAASLYHPQTVTGSLMHNGNSPLPGLKDDDGNWDRRPHRDRIQIVEEDILKTWKSVLEDDSIPWNETRMVYTVNTEAAAVLEKLAAAPRMKDLDLQFSSGWHETSDKKKGYFDVGWGHPDSWEDVILQGPHLGVSTPMIKQPNPTMKHNQDWVEIDLEALSPDFIPATAYQPNRNMPYNEEYAKWSIGGTARSSAAFYRVAWRTMAATTGFRTVYPSLIPENSSHLFTLTSAAHPHSNFSTVKVGATLSSLLLDFFFRSSGKAHILPSTAKQFPFRLLPELKQAAVQKYLRLNCVTSAYAPLWEEITGEAWTESTPIRNATERFHAQNEIDAIVALSLGVTVDELCMIYRTQFPVFRRYDQEDLYDANGRKVAKDIIKLQSKLKDGERLSEEERTWAHPQSEATYVFEYPFNSLDREADLKMSYRRWSAELLTS